MKVLSSLFMVLAGGLLGPALEVNWSKSRQLQWSDFMAKPNVASPHAAITHYQVRSNGKFLSWEEVECEVLTVFLKERSWVKKDQASEQLLSHEQLHFDLAECEARALRRALKNPVKPLDFNMRLEMLRDSLHQVFRGLQAEYDEETHHGIEQVMQERWKIRISDSLDVMREHSEPVFRVSLSPR